MSNFPLLFVVLNVLQFAICLGALAFGGREERLVGGSLLLIIVASKAAVANHWAQPEYAVLAVDILLLTLLGTLSMRTARWWLLWCSAFQLLIVLTHLAMMVDPTLRARGYSRGNVIWSWMTLIMLASATWSAYRRKRALRAGRSGG